MFTFSVLVSSDASNHCKPSDTSRESPEEYNNNVKIASNLATVEKHNKSIQSRNNLKLWSVVMDI